MQSYFDFLWSGNQFTDFFYFLILVDLTHLELTKRKERVKMLKFSFKAYGINKWVLVKIFGTL